MAAHHPGQVIDLGVLGTPGDEPGAPVRRPLARDVRAAAAALLVLAAAVLLGGSAVPPEPRVRQVAAISDDGVRSFTLGGDHAYVLTAGRLVAYRLADGTVQWRAAVPSDTFDVQYWADNGLLIGSTTSERTIAFDPADGTEVWRADGGYGGEEAGRLVLYSHPRNTDQVTLADRATGALVWSFEAPVHGNVAFDDATASVTMLYADGTVVERRLADGAELRRGRVPRQVRAADPSTHTTLDRLPGLLLLSESDTTRTTVSAYAAGTFAPLWRRDVSSESVNVCGDTLLCVTAGRGITALDARSGRQLWINPQFRLTSTRVDGLLVGNARAEDDPQLALLDPATGRNVATLGPVRVVEAGGTYALRRERLPGRRLVLGARTVVSALGRSGAGDPIGTVSGVVWPDCRGAERYLVCPTVLGQLTVHRVDAARG